jgi:hypothetical protein
MTVAIVLAMAISRVRASSAVPWNRNRSSDDPGSSCTYERPEPAMSASTTASEGNAQSAPPEVLPRRLAPHDGTRDQALVARRTKVSNSAAAAERSKPGSASH